MTDTDLIATIEQTAQETFRQPSLHFSREQIFRDIAGFDSVLAIQFILAIEVALDVTLNEEDVDNMHTMGNLLDAVKLKKAAVA